LKSIYDKIEKIYTQKESDEPAWVVEFRAELKEIKMLLKKGAKPQRKKRKSKAYFEFVNLLGLPRVGLQGKTHRGKLQRFSL